MSEDIDRTTNAFVRQKQNTCYDYKLKSLSRFELKLISNIDLKLKTNV